MVDFANKLKDLYNVLKSFLGFGADLPGMAEGFMPDFVYSAIGLFFLAVGILLLYKAIKALSGLIAGFIGGMFL